MMTSDKFVAREIAALMVKNGVKHAVLCPGSRNAPLIVAINRHPEIASYSMIDERSAAFFALGWAVQIGKPVAIVCTSGTAILNFAPAVAEAYYRHVPLVVISADRPLEWIDQDDSQTIRQNGVIDNIVKGSWTLPAETGTSQQAWYINRLINDSLLMAKAYPQGPVHLNVHLDIPLGNLAEEGPNNSRAISVVRPEIKLETKQAREMAYELAQEKRVLVIAGFMPPDQKVSKAMARLAAMPNVAVMCEAQANVHAGKLPIYNIDTVLSVMDASQREVMAPDIVVTVGGALVSRFVKDWLRKEGARRKEVGQAPLRHWHVGSDDYSVDCFQCLERRIEMAAPQWLAQITAFKPVGASGDYSQRWQEIKSKAKASAQAFAEDCPWSDFTAMKYVMEHTPEQWNLQLSNGTAIRYAQLFDYEHIHRIDCNRGVSGIDGCTSTAIGAAQGYAGTTMLVTGDMSAQYDLGALACPYIGRQFRMVVLNNNGGGIFRFVGQTARLEECEEFFCADVRLPLRDLAYAYKFYYFEARDAHQLEEQWEHFVSDLSVAAIFNLVTPPQDSADILRHYFKRKVL